MGCGACSCVRRKEDKPSLTSNQSLLPSQIPEEADTLVSYNGELQILPIPFPPNFILLPPKRNGPKVEGNIDRNLIGNTMEQLDLLDSPDTVIVSDLSLSKGSSYSGQVKVLYFLEYY